MQSSGENNEEFILPIPADLIPYFIIDEAVFTRLKVLIQAIFHIDYVLVLRGPLAVVLTTAWTSFLWIWILKYQSNVMYLLSGGKKMKRLC